MDLYDLKAEILSRLSLKTLDTVRCTNKELAALTYNSDFIDLHKQRNNIVSGFLVQYEKTIMGFRFAPSHGSSHPDQWPPCPHTHRILATSEQGIMVYATSPNEHKVSVYYVCKPATNQTLQLPNPNFKDIYQSKFAIVVMGSKPLRYKILRLARNRYCVVHATCRCEIFDSSKGEWRKLDAKILPTRHPVTEQPPTTVRGSIYMLLTTNDILKFDAYSEKWKIFSSPNQTLNYPSDTLRQLAKYGGKLALACRPPNRGWEIWVLMMDESWEKIYAFDGKNEIERMFLLSFYDADTSIMADDKTLVFYKFKENYSSHKVLLSSMRKEIFSIRSDFVPVDFTPVNLKERR